MAMPRPVSTRAWNSRAWSLSVLAAMMRPDFALAANNLGDAHAKLQVEKG